MRHIYWTFFIGAFFGTACSAMQEEPLAPITFSAQITVADSVDESGDFSGFNVFVYDRPSVNVTADTLFFGTTDSTGFVQGFIELKTEGAYPTQITRNGSTLATSRVLLASGDTVKITGIFPDITNSYSVDSREQRAMEVYNRVQNGFERTNRFIVSGQIPDSLLPAELQKWTDLFWEVYETKKGTFASKFAFEGAINLLDQFDKAQMFTKMNTAFEEELAYGLAITKGKEYVASKFGLDRAISYLDSVKSITKKEDIQRAVEQSIIKLNFDSARVEQSKTLIEKYNSKYNKGDVEPSFWYKNMRFEIANLAPGMMLPEFTINTTEGDTISNESMLGKAYILEFTQMANSLYQEQYDKATVIYQLYAVQGLDYFTIPFDASSNTVIAFFQERDRYWALAEPPSFNKKDFAEDFNIQFFPTRILVDKKGKIVRKFVGDEFDNIIPAITKTLSSN